MENNLSHTPPPYMPPPPPTTQGIPAPATSQVPTQEMYNYGADLLMNQKKSPEEVKQVLMQQGLDAENTSRVVSELQVAVSKQKNKRAKKDMLIGGIVFVIGVVITAVTYSMASESGGTYYVTWGAVVFSAIQFFKGLFSLKK